MARKILSRSDYRKVYDHVSDNKSTFSGVSADTFAAIIFDTLGLQISRNVVAELRKDMGLSNCKSPSKSNDRTRMLCRELIRLFTMLGVPKPDLETIVKMAQGKAAQVVQKEMFTDERPKTN